MRKFITKILFFTLAPLIVIFISYIVIPVKLLTYRPWEALTFSNIPANSPFYPNTSLDMNSVGDLCHHSNNSIQKHEYWKIDELGFRNDKYIKDIDILIIGDSYIAGSSLNQSNTISNRILNIDKNLKVYNMAPSSISQFDKLLNTGKINKPKLLIFSIVERNVPEKIQYYNTNSKTEVVKKIFFNTSINAQVDCFFKFLPFQWAKARVNGSEGNGIAGVNNSKMYFLRGTTQKHQKDDLVNTINILISYKKYCDLLGIKFIFMPMPDKETVYYELVPFDEQPDYLNKLDSILNISGVLTINTLKIYNDYRKTNDNLLYHLDDTHWNSNATEIIALEIIQKARTHNKVFAKKRVQCFN
jgi:hypothetical protein